MDMDMVEINQICNRGQNFRTALALAALTGKAVHFTEFRSKFRKPGLMRQHLACAKAIAEITGGTLVGAELKSQDLIFTPGRIRSGNYHFSIGCAGSVIPIAQMLIPVLLQADGPSRVSIEGATHVDGTPPFEFLERVYLPALRKMGGEVTATLGKTGFFPVGGGRITLNINPIREWKPFCALKRGRLLNSKLIASGCEINPLILKDEIRICQNELQNRPVFQTECRKVKSAGPGNILMAELHFEGISELFSACGDVGISRHIVAKRVAFQVQKYLKSRVPVGRFLADQLLLPMAIGAGGKFRTTDPTGNTISNMKVIQMFLREHVELENSDEGSYIIKIEK